MSNPRNSGRPLLIRCAIGVGMSLCLLACGGGGMTTEQLDLGKKQILESGQVAYFVGEEADGHELAFVVYPDGEFDAEGARFGYGTSCLGADCHEKVTLSTFSLSSDYLSMDVCERLQPVLGVPAAQLGESLIVFTEDWMVILTFDDRDGNLDKELALARELRVLGTTEPVVVLPPPTAAALSLIDRTCDTSR